MKNAVERISGAARMFGGHLRRELLSNPAAARDIEDMSSMIHASCQSGMLGRLYRGLQFGDFLASEAVGRLRESWHPRPRQCDTFLARTLRVPQYYGGIRQGLPKPGVLAEVLSWVAGLLGSRRVRDCVENYRVLEQIQERHIPAVLLKLFSYEDLQCISLPEAGESLKKLRSAILEARPEWTERRIVLDDLRQTEVESVLVKNLKKTVRCVFEFSTMLGGKDDGASKWLRQHFSGVLEFVKEDGIWKAASFTFSEL